MIDTIKKILGRIDIDHWKIIEKSVESKELFFIKKDLEMNRAKHVHHYDVTLFKDFESDEKKYKGSAIVKLASTMDENQIKEILKKGALSASLVKNAYYPMVNPSDRNQPVFSSAFDTENLMPLMTGLQKSLYKHDTYKNGGVNSAEIFVNKTNIRLLTSTGIDVEFRKFKGEIELITQWDENNNSVELYNMLYFSDYCPELIEEEAKKLIETCRDRALAVKAEEVKGINIILGPDAVKEMMNFYVMHSSASAVYEQLSKAKVGEVFQGENIKGDLVNIKLNPYMVNSPDSSPYDDDGFPLKEHIIFNNGVLEKYHGSVQFSSYLDIEPTGTIKNAEVEGGRKSYNEFKKEPHVEIVAFSDFQMDPLSGNFGGEIRLARYFDGEKEIPLTGASLSASIFDIHSEFYLSKETIQKDNYIGPKALMYKNGHLAGA